jgi:hypothetical protein
MVALVRISASEMGAHLFGTARGTFGGPDFDLIYVGEIWSSTGSTLKLLK